MFPRRLIVLGLAALGLSVLGGLPCDVTLVYDLPDPAAATAVEVWPE